MPWPLPLALYSSNFLGMTNLMSALPVIGYERIVFWRERGASMWVISLYIRAIARREACRLHGYTVVFWNIYILNHAFACWFRYDPFAYGYAMAIVEMPYLLVQSLLFVPIVYWMVAFKASSRHRRNRRYLILNLPFPVIGSLITIALLSMWPWVACSVLNWINILISLYCRQLLRPSSSTWSYSSRPSASTQSLGSSLSTSHQAQDLRRSLVEC